MCRYVFSPKCDNQTRVWSKGQRNINWTNANMILARNPSERILSSPTILPVPMGPTAPIIDANFTIPTKKNIPFICSLDYPEMETQMRVRWKNCNEKEVSHSDRWTLANKIAVDALKFCLVTSCCNTFTHYVVFEFFAAYLLAYLIAFLRGSMIRYTGKKTVKTPIFFQVAGKYLGETEVKLKWDWGENYSLNHF